jgi:hypothetical protein
MAPMSTLPTHLFTRLCIAIATSTLAACSASPDAAPPEAPPSTGASALDAPPGAPGQHLPGVVADCQAWAMRHEGRARYENNVWGSKKAQGKFHQCLLSRERNGKQEIGWTWNWPGFDPTVFAYPEVVVGWKPWSGGKTTDDRFPMKVSEVNALSLEYEVETSATGSYNLAPEIWLTESGASSRANPKSITTEVMFWMDYAAGARPAGSVIDHVELNGVTYELWREENIGADANGKGWQLLSFKSPERQLKGRIDIAALLRHLVTAKLVSTSDYVASVEFGNEVMGGTGTTWIKHFDVRVAP